MSDTGYKIRDQNGLCFITFSVVDWIDVFTRFEYSEIVVESLNYCIEKKGLNVFAWCLMSNHLHLIVQAREGYKLSEILRDFKKYTSSEITKTMEGNRRESRRDWMLDIFRKHGQMNSNNSVYQFWRQDNHPIELNTNEMIDQRMTYVHQNPDLP